MKTFVDNQIVKFFRDDPHQILGNELILSFKGEIKFKWPSLLNYLDLGSILSMIPPFSVGDPLFDICISILCTTEDKNVLFELYDRLFAENLNQLKSLKEIESQFILEAIRKKREKPSFSEVSPFILNTLDSIELDLVQKRAESIHDLVLYLGWERMCISLSRLFDHQSTDPKFIYGISVLKECLVESFQHITGEGKTHPSIYRLLEALFIYEMRQENLERQKEADWAILSQGFKALKPQDELIDYYYVDDAVVLEENLQKRLDANGEALVHCLTLDSQELVNERLTFAHFMVDKLKLEFRAFSYVLCPTEVFTVNL